MTSIQSNSIVASLKVGRIFEINQQNQLKFDVDTDNQTVEHHSCFIVNIATE